eukprot:6884349-Prymnesium_polylepis.1
MATTTAGAFDEPPSPGAQNLHVLQVQSQMAHVLAQTVAVRAQTSPAANMDILAAGANMAPPPPPPAPTAASPLAATADSSRAPVAAIEAASAPAPSAAPPVRLADAREQAAEGLCPCTTQQSAETL